MYVVDRCPFGDQPVVPGGVGCVDRVYGRPYDCYLPSVNAACCLSCEEIKTDITGKYSDISKNARFKVVDENIVLQIHTKEIFNFENRVRVASVMLLFNDHRFPK